MLKKKKKSLSNKTIKLKGNNKKFSNQILGIPCNLYSLLSDIAKQVDMVNFEIHEKFSFFFAFLLFDKLDILFYEEIYNNEFQIKVNLRKLEKN